MNPVRQTCGLCAAESERDALEDKRLINELTSPRHAEAADSVTPRSEDERRYLEKYAAEQVVSHAISDEIQRAATRIGMGEPEYWDQPSKTTVPARLIWAAAVVITVVVASSLCLSRRPLAE